MPWRLHTGTGGRKLHLASFTLSFMLEHTPRYLCVFLSVRMAVLPAAHHRQLATRMMSGDVLPVTRSSTSALMFTAFCGARTLRCAGWSSIPAGADVFRYSKFCFPR